MTTENATQDTSATTTASRQQGRNGSKPRSSDNPRQRVISNPSDVASLVLMQVDAVNAKKDDLTTAIRSLTDTTKQLARAYSDHTKTINELKRRVQILEGKDKS